MRIATIALCLFPVPAAAQTLSVVVKDGDVVAGVGAVTSIDNLAVNAAGTWLVEAATNNADTNANTVLLRSGVLQLREGDPLPAPAGATLDSLDAITLGDDGRSGWNFFLGNLTSTTDSGIYWDSTLVIQEGATSGAPQFSAGTPYVGFLETKYRPGAILVIASVDDPAIATTVDRALVLVTVDGAGALVSETVLVKEGDVLPGFAPETVAELGTGPHEFARAGNGWSLCSADSTGATATDGAIVLFQGAAPTILAREGDPSPIAGRNWEIVFGRPVDVNDAGEYVYRGNLDGDAADDEVIVKNNSVVVAREGSTLPAIAPRLLTAFGSGPVRISAAGDVFWFGDWDDPDTTRDMGLFVNDTLLVQEGVTVVGGQTITAIAAVQDSFSISDDGRYLIFECQLTGGVDAVVLLDRAAQTTPFCFGTPATGGACPCGNSGAAGHGCANSVNANGARLATSGVPSLAADTLVLLGSGMPDSSALYFQGTTQLGGGVGVPFGDGLRCAGGSVVRLGTKTNAGGSSQYPVAGDPSVSVRGLVTAPSSRTYQIWYRNAAAYCTASTFNLSNGVLVEWAS